MRISFNVKKLYFGYNFPIIYKANCLAVANKYRRQIKLALISLDVQCYSA